MFLVVKKDNPFSVLQEDGEFRENLLFAELFDSREEAAELAIAAKEPCEVLPYESQGVVLLERERMRKAKKRKRAKHYQYVPIKPERYRCVGTNWIYPKELLVTHLVMFCGEVRGVLCCNEEENYHRERHLCFAEDEYEDVFCDNWVKVSDGHPTQIYSEK